MPNNMDNKENMARPEAAPTTPVYDVKGELVGEVGLWPKQDDYFVMERGIFFKHTLYVPYAAIKAQDANGISLSLSKDDLADDQWKAPPGVSAEAAGTSPKPPPILPGSSGGPGPIEPGVSANPNLPPEER